MTTSRRVTANQKNALKSTGPRTKAGKVASSANAVQHGILSRHLILPGEGRVEFNTRLLHPMTEQQPVGTLEQALVRRMAVALWRQRRSVAAKTAQLQSQQAGLTYLDIIRVKPITGVDDMAWINALTREPMPDIVDLQSDVDAWNTWMDEEPIDADQDLARLPNCILRLWALLADELELDTPEQAGEKVLGDGAEGLYAWVESVRSQSVRLLKVVMARQPREADVLSRCHSSLDSELHSRARSARGAAPPVRASGLDCEAYRAQWFRSMLRGHRAFCEMNPIR